MSSRRRSLDFLAVAMYEPGANRTASSLYLNLPVILTYRCRSELSSIVHHLAMKERAVKCRRGDCATALYCQVRPAEIAMGEIRSRRSGSRRRRLLSIDSSLRVEWTNLDGTVMASRNLNSTLT